MISINNIRPIGDIRKDYHANTEAVVNHFLHRPVAREICKRVQGLREIYENEVMDDDEKQEAAKKLIEESEYEITDVPKQQQPCLVSHNTAVECFGEARRELMYGITHFIDRQELTMEEEHAIDEAIEDSDSDDSDDEGAHDAQSEEEDEEVFSGKSKSKKQREIEKQQQEIRSNLSRNVRETRKNSEKKVLQRHQMVVVVSKSRQKIKTELAVSTPQQRLEFLDICCLCKAIEQAMYKLTEIKLVGCSLSNRSIILLATTLKNFAKNINKVTIEMNSLGRVENQKDEAKFMADFVDSRQESIIRSELPQLVPSNLPEVSFANALCSILRCGAPHLSLRSCDIGDDGAAALATELCRNSTVHSLNLFGNNISDLGLGHIALALRSNRTLLCLNMGLNNDLTSDAGVIIASAFKSMELHSEEEFHKLRHSVYLSQYGQEKVPSTDCIPDAPVLADELAATKKQPTKAPPAKKKDGTPGVAQVELIEEWDYGCRRPMSSRPQTSGSTTKTPSNAKKKDAAKMLAEAAEPEPFIITVPGNQTLTTLVVCCNRNLNDESVKQFETIESNALRRLVFDQCRYISDQALKQLEEVFNEKDKSDKDEKPDTARSVTQASDAAAQQASIPSSRQATARGPQKSAR